MTVRGGKFTWQEVYSRKVIINNIRRISTHTYDLEYVPVLFCCCAFIALVIFSFTYRLTLECG